MNEKYPIGWAFIRAFTANGRSEQNEWFSHYIEGIYQVIETEDKKIWLKEVILNSR
jgi:hypothetical protein